MAVARLADIRPVQPIASLIQRLEDLENRLTDGTLGPHLVEAAALQATP